MAWTKAEEFYELYKASWQHKESLGLHRDWPLFDRYYRRQVNLPEDADDPGANTNIIHPAVEGQVADLVSQGLDFVLAGEEPSDQVFASDMSDILHWVLGKNEMTTKLDRFERARLKFGTGVWKTFYDPMALKGAGNISILPLNPAYVFPDPRISSIDAVQEGEFVIHATNRTHEYLNRRFDVNVAELLAEEGSYNPRFYQGENLGALNGLMKKMGLLLEIWVRDEDGGLRIVHVLAGKKPITLRDTQAIFREKARTGEGRKKRKRIYKYEQFPFTFVPCYNREGVLWGDGDIYFLIPTQDLINDLDDQILRNVRLMGNLQIVVNRASGINLRTWTPTPGLKIPATDHNAWRPVVPPNLPVILPQRRDAAFKESEMISSRSDIMEGRRSGSVRAASAIIAMQERGMVKANHKRLMMESAFERVLDSVIDQVKEFFTEERAFKIKGVEREGDFHKWFKGSDLRKIPRLSPDMSVLGAGSLRGLIPLLDEKSKPVLKDAAFDIKAFVGSGLPNNKAFLYQSLRELTGSIITPLEAREILRNYIKWPLPLKDAEELMAEMQGARQPQLPPEQGAETQMPMPQQQGGGGSPPDYGSLYNNLGPEFMGKVLSMLGGQMGGPGGMNQGLPNPIG